MLNIFNIISLIFLDLINSLIKKVSSFIIILKYLLLKFLIKKSILTNLLIISIDFRFTTRINNATLYYIKIIIKFHDVIYQIKSKNIKF